MILREGIRLYHGSYTIVREPDLRKCRGKKDFGQGFYLTTDKRQAESFVRSSVKKAVREGLVPFNTEHGYVSVYEFRHMDDSLSIYEFEKVDANWLYCIVGYRQPNMLEGQSQRWDSYDILAGKIANDNTNPTIIAYMSGLYGDVSSKEAIDQAVRLLLPFRLKNQVCFRTQKSIAHLTYIESEEVTWPAKSK